MIPDLDFWVRLKTIERAGPFALPLVTASTVYRTVYTAWFAGMVQGPEPTLNAIGWALKCLGCSLYWAGGTKAWLLPGCDEEAVKAAGGARYWQEKLRHVAKTGDTSWEPDPLYIKHNRDLYVERLRDRRRAQKIPKLYDDVGGGKKPCTGKARSARRAVT